MKQTMRIDNNTYIFSDPHYGHKNLVKGISSWSDKSGCRNFHTLEAHNEAIVRNINQKVPENATLICLGDWSFGGIENIWNFRKQIKCKDIHLILGNHDHHIANNKILPNCHYDDNENIIDGPILERYGDGRDDLFSVQAQDLFSSVSNYKEILFKKEGFQYDIILFHYAMRVWNKAHHGSIMLYGHSHGTLDEMTPDIANPTWVGDGYYIRNYRTKDIGLDTNNLIPYHIEEIIDDMKSRPVGFEIDHHKSKDNE